MDLGFNQLAFVAPKTKAEVSAVLDEAIELALDLEAQVHQLGELLADPKKD